MTKAVLLNEITIDLKIESLIELLGSVYLGDLSTFISKVS